jgi:tetratricopeptide (TPR) repeat protein
LAGSVRISAALIVRNEERFLEGCLAAVSKHVDEIVLVDTGSTDRTIEIAKQFGVAPLLREWRDDFAWARNEGLSRATGDWILYIDADERLDVPAGAQLSDGLDDTNAVTARLKFWPRVNATPFREYRLFRNDPRIRFRGAMHETVMPDLRGLIAGGGRVVESPGEIRHLGYEGDQVHKHVRNLPLLRSAVAEQPERLYYWHHLADTLAAMGETAEALAIAREGARRAESSPLSAAERAVASLLYARYARLLTATGADPMPAIDAGLAHYPTQPDLQLLKAQALIDRNEPDAALALLEPFAEIEGATYCDPALSHDVRIFDVFAHDLRGIALLRLGRRAEAADAFARAAANAPDDPSYRVKAMAIRPA